MKNHDYHIIKLTEIKNAHAEFKRTGNYIDQHNTLYNYLMGINDKYLNGLTIMQWTDLRRKAQAKWVDELHYQLKSFKLSELPEVRITLERIEQNRMTPTDNRKLWSKAQQIALTDLFKLWISDGY